MWITFKRDKELKKGSIFRFPFVYRADYRSQVGYLLQNEEGSFALIGNLIEAGWSELDQPAIETFDDEDESNDLDFEMF